MAPITRPSPPFVTSCVMDERSRPVSTLGPGRPLALRFASPELEVGIVSGDKDFGQLVNDHVYILDLMKNARNGREQVIERWGVPTERIIDLL